MYPSHDELIQLARILAKDLGYEGDVNAINGLCYGSCGPVMDHILTDIHKIVEFNVQLQWIKELIDDRHILENISLLSEEEKIKLLAFFGKILPNQKPYAFIRSKKLGRIPYAQELAETMPLVQSDALKKLGGLYKITVFSGFYNLDTDTDIFNYLTALKKTVEELPSAVDIPFSLLILNGIHAVLLGYNSANNQYPLAFFDIAQGAIHKLNFQNMGALLPLLKNGLLSSDNDSKNYAIVTGLYCAANKKREALKLSKDFQSNLDSWGLTKITLEKINQKAALDYTYLHLAARLGDIDAVQSIINLNTAHIDLLSNNGWSPLMYASQRGHTKIVELLLQNGAKVNLQQQDGRSAITYAIQDGHVETVALFIQYEANINLCSHSGLSPIMIAAKNKQAKIVELLIKNDAYSFTLWDIFICPIDGADIIMALIKENSATLDQYLSPILKSHDSENKLLTNIVDALFQISNETQIYRQIDDFEIVFRRKFSILMKKDTLTPEDKKCLIKLYILLCAHDEMRHNNSIVSGLILFFKQEYTYKKKIEIAHDLLTAVENKMPIPAGLLASQDGNLKIIASRCFPEEKECPVMTSSLCV
jgi:Ankyrin repeats (3 copies)/Ankyrin repeats (many copies)